MENKQDNTLAWVSYITIIGWIVALIIYNDSQKGNSLVRFHLKQSLGLFILYLAGFIVITILVALLMFTIPALAIGIGFIGNLYYLALLVFLILGIVNAAQNEEKHLPLVGKFFDEKLTFIK
jgi:uncharacterized membrane protein